MMQPKPTRPILDVPRTTSDRLVEAGAALGLVALAIVPLLTWSDLPDRVPLHFDAAGNPDSWAGRWTVFGLPAVAAVLYAGLTVVARFPQVFNYPWQITEDNAAAQYRIMRSMIIWLKAEIVWLFIYVEWRLLQTATGDVNGLDPWFMPVFLGLIFGTMGYFMYKGYRAR